MNTRSCNCSQIGSESYNNIEKIGSLLKIVGETSRLRLLCILSKGDHCVCELMKHVDFSQSLISHHLRDLKDTGIVSDEKRGQRVYYSLTEKGRQITELLLKIQS